MTARPESLVDHLGTVLAGASEDAHAVELAVGRRPGVALALADRGFEVVATDLRTRDVPEGVTFVQDDLLDPDVTVYEDAGLLYARNLPAELQRPARELAESVGAPLYFTMLGAEEPVVPVSRTSYDEGTLYRATAKPD